ncbi:hypothetical protein D029_4835B, partial [Vibrio parahaemolyticus 970107]
SSPMSI